MTKKEMENAIRNLQSAVSFLAAKTYSRNSDTEDDVAKVSGDIAEVGAKANETAVVVEGVNETMDIIVTDELPALVEQSIENSELLEQIITEIIPSMME